MFLISRALGLDGALTLNLISATFLVCGLGSLLQSFGPFGFGARLPFIMVPGGAPIAIFLVIAQQTSLRTAVGAVLITGVAYLLILPIFARCLRFFPQIVVGTMLLLVGINLVKIYGGIVGGTPGSPGFGLPSNVLLALATIGFTVVFARVLRGHLAQLSVLFGLLAGAVTAAVTGNMAFGGVLPGAVFSLPTPFPFGMPVLDPWAAVPLVVFSVIFVTAGLVTGITETTTGIGGPPLALVFQHQTPSALRANVALCFLIGEILSIVLLIAVGSIGAFQVRAAMILMPGMVLGVLCSGPARRRLDAGLLRHLVLLFSATWILLKA